MLTVENSRSYGFWRVASVVSLVLVACCGALLLHYWHMYSVILDLRARGCFIVGEMQAVELSPNFTRSEVVRALRSVRSLGSPHRLVLDGTDIDAGIADEIAQFNSPRWLSVSDSGLTDDLLRKFTHFDRLEILALDGTAVSDASIPVIVSMGHLKVLYIRDTRISEDGVRTLRASIPVVHSD